jgi:hypothetical protein
MGKLRNNYKISVGKPEGKRPLESPRRKREDNIKIDLIKVGSEGAGLVHLVQYMALVSTVMNHKKAGNFLAS